MAHIKMLSPYRFGGFDRLVKKNMPGRLFFVIAYSYCSHVAVPFFANWREPGAYEDWITNSRYYTWFASSWGGALTVILNNIISILLLLWRTQLYTVEFVVTRITQINIANQTANDFVFVLLLVMEAYSLRVIELIFPHVMAILAMMFI